MGSFPFNLPVTAVPDVRIFMCTRSLAALRSVTIHQYRNRNVIVKLATVHGTMLKIFERYRNWNFTVHEKQRVHAFDLDCLLSGFQLLVKFSSTALALLLIHSWRALVLGSFPVIRLLTITRERQVIMVSLAGRFLEFPDELWTSTTVD